MLQKLARHLVGSETKLKISQSLLLDCQQYAVIGVRSSKPRAELHVPIGEPTNPRNEGGGAAFSPWVQEVVRYEEVAMIFLRKFSSRSLVRCLDFRVVDLYPAERPG